LLEILEYSLRRGDLLPIANCYLKTINVNSGELDPPVPGDVDPTLVVIEEQYYKERFDSNQIYLS
jgi:hypothetical protein